MARAKICVVSGCKNRGGHKFPRDDTRRCLWMKAARLENLTLKCKNLFICRLHFKVTDYMDSYYELSTVRGYLKRHAVPSIFPWNPEFPMDSCTSSCEVQVESGASDEFVKDLSDYELMAGPDLVNTEEQHAICNSCLEPIDGFRYLCMECVKFEQCARCEAMRAHDHHYMLRVPGPRPEEELRAVATEVRAALASRPHLTTPQIVQIKVDQDIKYEVEIEAIEPDPLDTDLQPLSDHTTEYQEPPLQTGSFLGASDCTTLMPRPPPPALTSACIKISNTYQRTLPKTLKVVTSPKDKSTCAKILQKTMPLERKSEHIQPKRKITSESSGTMPVPFKLLKREPDSADEDDTGDLGIASSHSHTYNNIDNIPVHSTKMRKECLDTKL